MQISNSNYPNGIKYDLLITGKTDMRKKHDPT